MINALCTVRAWIEVIGAELNFLLTKLAIKASQTTASVRLNTIDTCSIVLTFMIFTVINIDFTSRAFVARQAFTAEPSLLEYTATSIISTRIAIACINHVLAMHTMIAWSTATFILLFRFHDTLGIVFAWEGKACIAFRQNLITDFLFADELTCRR